MSLVIDDTLLREPNLLIPGRKPVGPVRTTRDAALTLLPQGRGFADASAYYPGTNTDADGGSVRFTAANASSVALPDIGDLLSDIDVFTAVCRCYIKYSGTNQLIWGAVNSDGFGDNAEVFELGTDGSDEVFFFFATAGTKFVRYTLPEGWHTLVGRKSGTALAQLWVDGVLAAEETSVGSGDATGTHHYLGRPFAASRYFNDRIAFAQLFNEDVGENAAKTLSRDPYQFLVPA